jgi:hypothetical protein
MRSLPSMVCLALCAILTSTAAPVRASFHLWGIKEVFSSPDGAVQFVEFFTTSSGQEFLSGHNLVATSDGVNVTFNFTSNIPVVFPETTANHHFLAATAGFGALAGGVAPDFTIPAHFFNPNAASISFNFAGGFDTLALAGATFPKDGIHSLTDSNTAAGGPDNMSSGVNSPRNFAGTAGSVNLAPPPLAGDFDENGTVAAADLTLWRGGFGMQGASVEHNDGDADADDDVDGTDFLAWQRQLGSTQALANSGAVPEPAAATQLAAVLLAAGHTRRRRA